MPVLKSKGSRSPIGLGLGSGFGSGGYGRTETESEPGEAAPAVKVRRRAPARRRRPAKVAAAQPVRETAAPRHSEPVTTSEPAAAPVAPARLPDSANFFELTERFPDEKSAEQYFTQKRWPDGPICTSCKSKDVYDCHSKRRHTQWKCRGCGKQFTVTSGTVMEHTMIPLRKWLFAYHLMGGAKKGISTRQMARHLGVTVKSAWHLTHRIRATMTNNGQVMTGIVESDETYIGGKRKHVGKGYRKNKIPVQVIVQRTEQPAPGEPKPKVGQIQNIVLNPDAERVDGRTVGAKLRKHTDPAATTLMTDESNIYTAVGKDFEAHHTVNHKKEEYVREEPDGCLAHTNTAEGSFGNLKRQITGTHHSVSKKHLPRYLEEYDHKYNHRDHTDTQIAEKAIANIEGRRVRLYKSASGGDSLIDHKQGEPGKPGTRRGSSKHVRTGKKKGTENAGGTGSGAGNAGSGAGSGPEGTTS